MLSDKELTRNCTITDSFIVEGDKKNTLQIAVCDDEREHLQALKKIFENVKVSVLLEPEYFVSAEELLEKLYVCQENGEALPDIIFCDIKMPGMDGIAFGKKIQALSSDIYLVLITAYSEYAIRGYETGAFRFLLKPVTVSDVERVLSTILVEKGRSKKLLIRTTEEKYLLELSDIIYLASEDKYTILYTKNGYYVDRTSLKDYEKMLDAYGFCRIHRKYLVNLSKHKGIGRGKVTLHDGTELPISRRREAAYHTKLLQLLGEDLLP